MLLIGGANIDKIIQKKSYIYIFPLCLKFSLFWRMGGE